MWRVKFKEADLKVIEFIKFVDKKVKKMRYKRGVKGGKINPFGNEVVLDSVEYSRI